jgi:hypothetical protein
VDDSLVFISAVSIWLIAEVLVDSTVVGVELDVAAAEDTQTVVHTAGTVAANTHMTTARMTNPV